ncbi:hypothetical protein AKJ16_DCAP18957 [Drosera capensis]
MSSSPAFAAQLHLFVLRRLLPVSFVASLLILGQRLLCVELDAVESVGVPGLVRPSRCFGWYDGTLSVDLDWFRIEMLSTLDMVRAK